MNFQSFEFLGFVVAVVAVYHALPRFRVWTLLAASLLFYASWSVSYALFFTALVTFVFWIAPLARYSRFSLILGICVCLGNLLFFKSAATFPSFPGNWILPLGISYTTFKLISYLVDVSWEKIQPEKNWGKFLSYVFFFPQIVSGPIQRAEDFLPQLEARVVWDAARITTALQWITFGLFKKMVIADHLALIVNPVFAQPSEYPSTTVLLAMYAFTLEVYADFSGLTDLAKGLALLFGIDSPDNFRGPLYAPNLQEFWRRWHITLTSWVRDYLFIPLHMQLRNYGTAALVFCITANMMVIALWHGFTTNFVIFGLIQAMWMNLSTLTMQRRNRFFKRFPQLARPRAIWGALITFNLTTASFVFVKAHGAGQAFQVFQALGAGNWSLRNLNLGLSKPALALVLACIVLMEIIHVILRNPDLQKKLQSIAGLRWVAYYMMVFTLLGFGAAAQPFIYFKF